MTTSPPMVLATYTQFLQGIELALERGCLRISLLADDIVRVRFTPGSAFLPRRSWDTAEADETFAPISFTITENDEQVLLTTAALTVCVNRVDGGVSFLDAVGQPFAADLAPLAQGEAKLAGTAMKTRPGDTLPEGPARTEWRLQKAMHPDEAYLGLGQRGGMGNRRGRSLSNWTVDPDFGHGRQLDNLYQAHPFVMAVRPELAWGLLLHSTWYSAFDLGTADPDIMQLRTLGAEFDYYVFAGPTPAAVVEQLTRLTGRPFLPPLWAMGFHQSRWGYASETDMRTVAREFHQRHIPIDVIHFDIDYMDGYRVFTWHPERFSQAKQLLAELRTKGIRAVTIVDPGVKYDVSGNYPVAEEGIKEQAFIMNPAPDDMTLYTGTVWPGLALFPDFTIEKARAWWGAKHQGLLEDGVAGIWNDMNEPSISDRPFLKQEPPLLGTPQGAGEERTVHAEVRNLYGLLMARATYEGLQALRPSERPWILTRSGFTGIQRYAAAWMGDNHSWWEHLEMSLPQLCGMALSGVPFVGVDIGGFFDRCSPELFVRWLQMGTFYPFMRDHTCAGTPPQEPWAFGEEVEEIAREFIGLRYRLLPYLYTLAHIAHGDGTPLLRPLVYDFPADANTVHIDDQVMVGPHLLVAPITRPGVTHRMVYLPAGVWYDYWTGERLTGAQWTAVEAPLARIPVFVRGGAVLTLGNVRQSTNEPVTELTLDVYPAGESAWTWIEDDGLSFACEQGAIAETTATVSATDDGVVCFIAARQGAYTPAPRTITLRVHTDRHHHPEALQVIIDGCPTNTWSWDADRLALQLTWTDTGEAKEVIVRW